MKNMKFHVVNIDICVSTVDDTRHRTVSWSGI